jgi:exosortase/archaeosortase family protein
MRLVGRNGAANMNDRRSSWLVQGLVVTALVLPLLVAVLEPLTRLQIVLFCAPAAHLAAGFLGAPVTATIDGFVIPTAWPIEVTTACSGIRFFSLTTAVLVGLAVEQRRRWRFWLSIPWLAYAGTVGANTSRILSTWYIDAWFAPHLPHSLQKGVHGLTGALVFTVVLAFLYAILWRTHHEHRTQTPAA